MGNPASGSKESSAHCLDVAKKTFLYARYSGGLLDALGINLAQINDVNVFNETKRQKKPKD
jgi:hypothetical protein